MKWFLINRFYLGVELLHWKAWREAVGGLLWREKGANGSIWSVADWNLFCWEVGGGGDHLIFYITSLFYIRTQTLPLENGSGGWGEGGSWARTYVEKWMCLDLKKKKWVMKLWLFTNNLLVGEVLQTQGEKLNGTLLSSLELLHTHIMTWIHQDDTKSSKKQTEALLVTIQHAIHKTQANIQVGLPAFKQDTSGSGITSPPSTGKETKTWHHSRDCSQI